MASFARSNLRKSLDDDKKEQDKRREEAEAEREREDRASREASRKAKIEVLRTLARRLRSNRRRYRGRKDEQWDRILRIRTMQLCAFSLVGLITSVILSAYKWASR